MKNNIDIDFFYDGFDVKRINCIHNPIAAIAGYYDRINYFFYCYLYCLFNYWENTDDDYLFFSNKVLSIMGLKLKSIKFENDEDVLKSISDKVLNGDPILLICKYNSLFYNNYYGNDNYKLDHGLVVSGYNSDNKTFIINESSLLRNVMLKSENSDIFFPLQITSTSLKEIIIKSNKQFINDDYCTKNFMNRIFYITKIHDTFLNVQDIISKSLEYMDKSIGSSLIINDISKLGIDENIKLNYENYFQKYILGLDPIFKLLYLNINNDKLSNEVKEIEEKIKLNNKNVISKFIKNTLKKVPIDEKKKKEMIDQIKESNILLKEVIQKVSLINNKSLYMYTFIDIKDYYNCKAFEECISDDSIADITGEGTHYLFKNIPANKIWKKMNYEFIYKYAPSECDNISCKGQTINVDFELTFSSISILGCSEYGSYNEEIIIDYFDRDLYSFFADFSDFYQHPIYGENIFWSGMALDRKNGKTIVHNFNARLFSKRYKIPKGRIKSIKLPQKKNIHIFAITLEEEMK